MILSPAFASPRRIAQDEATAGRVREGREAGLRVASAMSSPALATRRRSSKVIWIRCGLVA